MGNHTHVIPTSRVPEMDATVIEDTGHVDGFATVHGTETDALHTAMQHSIHHYVDVIHCRCYVPQHHVSWYEGFIIHISTRCLLG